LKKENPLPRIGTPLDTGDLFPPMTLPLADGGSVTLPDAARAGWAILLLYRGHW
jgi:peroxiredoxin